VARVHASSGTTGKPTVVGYTARDIDTWASVVARSMRAAGTRPGDVVHVAYGYGLFHRRARRALRRGKARLHGRSRLGRHDPRQVQLIEDFGASTIMVTPSYALSILDEYREQGRDPRESPLQVGIFGAEPWTNAMRSEIEQAFDMHAVDIYGLARSWAPASPTNASRPRTACISGRITSTPR
jgi:phenylacetate-CoA ligase